MDNAQRAQALREIAEEKEAREQVYDEAIRTLEEVEATLYEIVSHTLKELERVSGEVNVETEPDAFEKSSDLYYELAENPQARKLREAIDTVRKGLDEVRRFVLDAIDV